MIKNLNNEAFQKDISSTDNIVLLDVRTPAEFDSAHIPGAINLNVMDADFIDQLDGLDKHKTHYIYCRSGGRSMQACMMMNDQGFNVVNLDGGITNWRGPVEQ